MPDNSASDFSSVDAAIRRLEKEAATWEGMAKRMRKAIKTMRKEVGGAKRLVAKGGKVSGTNRSPRGRRPRGKGAASLALQVLQDEGRPMRAAELLPLVQERGAQVGGANPAATLASTLLKYPQITRVSRGLFVPAEESEGQNGDPAPASPASTKGRKKARARGKAKAKAKASSNQGKKGRPKAGSKPRKKAASTRKAK